MHQPKHLKIHKNTKQRSQKRLKNGTIHHQSKNTYSTKNKLLSPSISTQLTTSQKTLLYKKSKRSFSGCGDSGHVCGCGGGANPDEISQEEKDRLTEENIKTIKRMQKQQRDFSLRLYRSILRAHRYLPPDMRLVGDAYVSEEFKLHKNAKPEHLQPFYEQWIQYLGHLRQAFDQPEALGLNIPHEDLDALDDEKREKLFQMHDETARIFGGQLVPADVGLSHIPENFQSSGIFAEDNVKVDNHSPIITSSVKQQQQDV